MGFDVSQEVLQEATCHLTGRLSKGDVNKWIVFICFWGHPHTLWDFMLDAVEMAVDDRDLQVIATELAEHILAHYGSMIGHFESRASSDRNFRRMLTGVWRHRMSDEVHDTFKAWRGIHVR